MTPTRRSSCILFLAAGFASAQEAPASRPAPAPSLAARCDSRIPWIDDGYSGIDGQAGAALPKVDRGALLDAALARAAREKRLVLWYVPRIAGGHTYRSPVLDDYMRISVFTDERICALVEARFVPLRAAADAALGDRVGVKSLDWVEPALAILAPDGRLLRRFDRIRTFNAEALRLLLIGTLEAHRDLAPTPATVLQAIAAARDDDPRALGAAGGAALAAGCLAEADAIADRLIAAGREPEGRLLGMQASRDRETALARAAGFLEIADRPQAGPFRPFARVARAKVAFLEGSMEEAERLLAALAEDGPAPMRPAILYRLAAARLQLGDSDGAAAAYRELVAKFPEHPHAWQAAAHLEVGRDTTPRGPAFHHFEDLSYPTRADVARLATAQDTRAPRPPSEAHAAVDGALDWLLRRQDRDGRWRDARYAYWPTPEILPNVRTCVTAAAAAALLDWRDRDPARVDRALRAADRALFDAGSEARGRNEEIYADGFRVLYLVKRLAALDAASRNAPDGPDRAARDAEAKTARERLGRLVREISRQQSDAGFFGHEYPNPFTTAATMVLLDQARRGGAAVGDTPFEAGAAALLSTRNARGAFGYGKGRVPAETEEKDKDGSARAPVCAHALRIAGKGDGADVERALETFEKYLPRLERIRTCDFHADGELGGFFYWHAVYFASQALSESPDASRRARAARLLEGVLAGAESDGAFLDSHETGKSYGVAMALLTMKNLLAPGAD
ncbi:MAG TPA: tetratricopeptide repeat protein [Planctomycetota bacterium]|nr:tetratricopeptide repeat protein [Planctomycetota bacterium]